GSGTSASASHEAPRKWNSRRRSRGPRIRCGRRCHNGTGQGGRCARGAAGPAGGTGPGLMRLRWPIIFGAMIVAMLPVLLAACARDDGATTIRFWAMGREAEVVADLLRDFEREHPGIRAELQPIPWTAAHEKLLTAWAADALPD